MIQMKNFMFKKLAIALQAWENSINSKNHEWQDRWYKLIKRIEEELPSGSGFDNGTSIDLAKSDGNKIVLNTSFHHMNENGCYDGWTDHTVIVKPSLIHHFELDVKGRNRNDIKEYIYEVFANTLMREIDMEAKDEL